MIEAWRPVPACRWYGIKAGMLAASSEGRVRTHAGRVLAPVADKDDYLRVKFYGRWISVAVLVALAFHGPPEVRHLSGNRQVNKPAELAWGSRRENERDKRRGNGRGGYPPVQPVTEVTGGLAG